MKQLFLKSNILHIRTNDGEYEVSNPEVIPSKMKNYADAPEGLFSPVEWPYSYELIDKPNGYPDELCARLIPEEKKKPVFIPEDHPFASTGRASKFYETKTESAYKEREKDQYGNPVFDSPEEEAEYREKTLAMANRIIDGLTVNKANLEHIAQTGKINGSLRQELIDKIFSKLPVSAPSESQEELWIDVSNVFTVAGHGDAAHNHLLRRFTITRKPE